MIALQMCRSNVLGGMFATLRERDHMIERQIAAENFPVAQIADHAISFYDGSIMSFGHSVPALLGLSPVPIFATLFAIVLRPGSLIVERARAGAVPAAPGSIRRLLLPAFVAVRPNALAAVSGPNPFVVFFRVARWAVQQSEEHTSELQSRFGISYAVFCLKK